MEGKVMAADVWDRFLAIFFPFPLDARHVFVVTLKVHSLLSSRKQVFGSGMQAFPLIFLWCDMHAAGTTLCSLVSFFSQMCRIALYVFSLISRVCGNSFACVFFHSFPPTSSCLKSHHDHSSLYHQNPHTTATSNIPPYRLHRIVATVLIPIQCPSTHINDMDRTCDPRHPSLWLSPSNAPLSHPTTPYIHAYIPYHPESSYTHCMAYDMTIPTLTVSPFFLFPSRFLSHLSFYFLCACWPSFPFVSFVHDVHLFLQFLLWLPSLLSFLVSTDLPSPSCYRVFLLPL